MTNNQRTGSKRRANESAPFPLKDSEGNTITAERRQIPDRRLDNINYEQRLFLYAEMPRYYPDNTD